MKVVLDDCVYMKLNDVKDLVHSGILPAYFLNDISKRRVEYYNNEQFIIISLFIRSVRLYK